MLKAELCSPKNSEYTAICDVDSTKRAPDAMLMKLRASNISVSPKEMCGAFCQRLSDKA